MNLLQIEITATGAAAATAKDLRDALRNAFEYIGRLWDKLYKMKRFASGATRRYGLTPRRGQPGSGRAFKGSYTEAKLKRRRNGSGVRAIGETKPFVWSGDSRSRAAAQHRVVARASSHTRAYAENILDLPTLNLTPATGRIKMREEFQTVREDERHNLEGLGAGHYENALNRIPATFALIA